MRYTVRTVVILLVLMGGTLPVWAADPMEDLKGPINEVIRILKDPKYQDKSQSEAQRVEIMAAINSIFDFNEISKRTIGRRWKSFSKAQQQEFQTIFADFLGYTYFQKIRDAYQGESVNFLSQDSNGKDKAIVKTSIPREQGEIPLDYRMYLSKNGWQIYDVIIEGVSLVKNYRTQFNQILSKENPAQLISRLKQKITEQRQGASS